MSSNGNPWNIQTEPGWLGAFTRNEQLGAWRNGTRIVKVKEEETDGTPLGTGGTVLGSVYDPHPDLGLLYFVEWDDKPRVAVGVVAWKITHEGLA